MLRLVCSLPEHNLLGARRGARYLGYLFNRFTNKNWAGPGRSYSLHGSFFATRLVSLLPRIGADQPCRSARQPHDQSLTAPRLVLIAFIATRPPPPLPPFPSTTGTRLAASTSQSSAPKTIFPSHALADPSHLSTIDRLPGCKKPAS